MTSYTETRAMERATAKAMAQITRKGIPVTYCDPGKAYGLQHAGTNYAPRGRTFTPCEAARGQHSCIVYERCGWEDVKAHA